MWDLSGGRRSPHPSAPSAHPPYVVQSMIENKGLTFPSAFQPRELCLESSGGEGLILTWTKSTLCSCTVLCTSRSTSFERGDIWFVSCTDAISGLPNRVGIFSIAIVPVRSPIDPDKSHLLLAQSELSPPGAALSLTTLITAPSVRHSTASITTLTNNTKPLAVSPFLWLAATDKCPPLRRSTRPNRPSWSTVRSIIRSRSTHLVIACGVTVTLEGCLSQTLRCPRYPYTRLATGPGPTHISNLHSRIIRRVPIT